ncbi:MAG: UDP-N-acetylmuramoyl-L-alanine--D-glutamate ligase [Alphaproteobacteria bacterium]|nr:UDP-N-acetylmuramoyl-L-alanine--D-glutamate ligase [Alphaproteobacteria bacterium]
MISPEFYKNKNIVVVGYGKTGQSAVNALKSVSANVYLLNDSMVDSQYYCTIDEIDWTNVDYMMVSPGVSLVWNASPAVSLARKFSVPIINDIDILQQSINAKLVAVTGTNGKSTTTSLIYYMLAENGAFAEIGGNFGTPALSLKKNADFYVLELSSYQLESCNILGFDFSVLLNIASDHLTRHGGINGYIAMKQKIFAHSRADSVAVIGVDDEYCQHLFDHVNHKNVIQISGKNVPNFGIGWANNKLIDDRRGNSEFVCHRCETLDGEHNRQNIAAAYAVCSCAGVSKEVFAEKLFAFKGLEHRQELVKTINGVQYVNDSKATNADSVEQALRRFDNIIWILGGRAKEDGIERLIPYFSKIRCAFLIGEIALEWHELLSRYNVKNEVSVTLNNAVQSAYQLAKKGDVVLLSTACASFDQFRSFEDRGDNFKRLVETLPC